MSLLAYTLHHEGIDGTDYCYFDSFRAALLVPIAAL
jgi:hypothetical protein